MVERYGTDKEELWQFLRHHCVGVLATVNEDLSPHATVIYYSVDEKQHVCFVTKRLTRKSANLTRDNRAELVVYDAATQTTASISGRAREITDVFKSQAVFAATLEASLLTSPSEVPPVATLAAGDYIAYCLSVDDGTMIQYDWSAGETKARG